MSEIVSTCAESKPPLWPGDVSIVAGDPRAVQTGAEGGIPASFSRFVLPLPYRLAKWQHERPKHVFQEAGPADWLHSPTNGTTSQDKQNAAAVLEASLDRERRDYFTRETSAVLYERAGWFVLNGPLRDSFDLHVRLPLPEPGKREGAQESAVNVCMRPPALVLFECPESPHEDGRTGVLPQAMIVLEVWWGTAEQRTGGQAAEQTSPAQPRPELAETKKGVRAPCLDDVLVLNELFRYFQRPYERHSRPPEKHGNRDHNYGRALAELPVDWCEGETSVAEALKGVNTGYEGYLRRWEWMLECPVEWAGELWRFVPEKWIEATRCWVGYEPRSDGAAGVTALGSSRGEQASEDPDASPPHGWLLYADNRAYVWTCVVTKHEGLLQRVKGLKAPEKPMGRDLGYWLRLVNMDPLAPEVVTCTSYEAEWADKRTYRRWAHYGALQGFNYHGGAMLTGPCDEPPTWRHFGAMYFDQALLLLYLRVTLFRFSHDLYRLSALARKCHDNERALEELASDFAALRLDFALFTNLYQFPLLSNQQQGIELYSACREQMDVQDLFEQVKSEVEATHEFLELRAERKMAEMQMKMSGAQTDLAEMSGRLTVVATVGLVAALVLAAFGVSDFASKPFLPPRLAWWSVTLLLVGVSAMFIACLLVVLGIVPVLQRVIRVWGCVHHGPVLTRFKHWLESKATEMERQADQDGTRPNEKHP